MSLDALRRKTFFSIATVIIFPVTIFTGLPVRLHADRASEVLHDTKVFNRCLIKKRGLESQARERAKCSKNTYLNGKIKL